MRDDVAAIDLHIRVLEPEILDVAGHARGNEDDVDRQRWSTPRSRCWSRRCRATPSGVFNENRERTLDYFITATRDSIPPIFSSSASPSRLTSRGKPGVTSNASIRPRQ